MYIAAILTSNRTDCCPIPVKAAMNMLGYKAGPVRAPLTELSDAHKELLEKALKDYGVL